jgi:argininosuccinate lyase
VDIADHLARTQNLSFRECYHLLARAVKLSSPETKITTAALIKALADSNHPTEIAEDLAELHDPQKILKLRQHQGSPSPEQTSLHIEELSAELNSLSAPLVDLQNNIIAAQENCQNYGV